MYVVYNTVVQLQLFNACLHTFIDSDRCWLCFNCSNVSCDSFSSSVSSLIWKFTHGWCSQWHQDMFSFQQYLWKPSDCNSNEKTCIYIRMMKVYCVYVKSMKLTCVHTRTPYELPLGTVYQCTHSFPVTPSAPLWVIGLCGCGSKCFAVVFCSHQLSFQAVKTKGGLLLVLVLSICTYNTCILSNLFCSLSMLTSWKHTFSSFTHSSCFRSAFSLALLSCTCIYNHSI